MISFNWYIYQGKHFWSSSVGKKRFSSCLLNNATKSWAKQINIFIKFVDSLWKFWFPCATLPAIIHHAPFSMRFGNKDIYSLFVERKQQWPKSTIDAAPLRPNDFGFVGHIQFYFVIVVDHRSKNVINNFLLNFVVSFLKSVVIVLLFFSLNPKCSNNEEKMKLENRHVTGTFWIQ